MIEDKAVTVCTTYFKEAGMPSTALWRTCRKYRIKLHAFGTESRFESFLRTKMIPLRDFVARVKTKFVMFLDGNDTFLVAPLCDILRSYEELTAGRTPLLIGSESENWPYPFLKLALDERAKKAGAKSKFRYLDPGLVLGERRTVLKAFDTIIESVEQYRKELPEVKTQTIEDDVGLWALNICAGRVDPVIDYGCQIIAALKNCAPESYGVRDGRLLLHVTKTAPHIIHCNGHRSFDRKRLHILYREATGDKKIIAKLRRSPARDAVCG